MCYYIGISPIGGLLLVFRKYLEDIKEERKRENEKRMMAAMIGLCMITLMGCGSKDVKQETNTKVTESEVKETTQNNTKENDMSEVTFDYTILDDGTLSIWSYNAENVPEVFEIPEEIDGQTVSEIRGSLFASEDKIKEVIIPETVTSIGKETFQLATSIEKIEIRGNVEELGDYAFFACKGIKELRFNEGLKYIGKCALSNDDNLTDIYLPGTIEDVTPYSNFGLCADTLRVHVPAGSTAESVVTEAVEGLDSSTVIEVIAE